MWRGYAERFYGCFRAHQKPSFCQHALLCSEERPWYPYVHASALVRMCSISSSRAWWATIRPDRLGLHSKHVSTRLSCSSEWYLWNVQDSSIVRLHLVVRRHVHCPGRAASRSGFVRGPWCGCRDPCPITFVVSDAPGISYPASRPGGALCAARASVGDLIRSTCSFHTDRPENTVSSFGPSSFDSFAMAGTASVHPTPPPRAPSALRSSVRPVRTTPTCPLWVRLGRVRRGPRIVRRVPSVRTNPMEFGRRRVVENQGVA